MGLGIHAGYGLNIREDRIDFVYDENVFVVTDEDLSQVSEDIWEEYFDGSHADRAQAVKVWNARSAQDRISRARDIREAHCIQRDSLDPKVLMVSALQVSYHRHQLGWG